MKVPNLSFLYLLSSDIERVLRKMRAENKEMKRVRLERVPGGALCLIIDGSDDPPPSSRATSAGSGDRQEDNAPPEIIITIQTAIEGKGWPTGVPLKHPLPNTRPWSILGSLWVNDAKSAIEDGQSLWYLEEGNTANMQGDSNWPIWDLSFMPLEDEWEKRLRKLDTMVHLHTALHVFKLIKQGRSNISWELLNTHLMRHVLFSWVRNSADKNKTLADWVLSLFAAITQMIKPEAVCGFFCAQSSLVKETELPLYYHFRNGVEAILQDLKSDPSSVINYVGTGDIPDRQEQEEEEGGELQQEEDGLQGQKPVIEIEENNIDDSD